MSTIKNAFQPVISSESTKNKRDLEQIVENAKAGSFISRNMIPEKFIEKCEASELTRTKRNIDPISNLDDFELTPIHSKRDYIRVKRSAEAQLRNLQQEYTRCNRGATPGKCVDIYNKYMILVKEVKEKLNNFAADFNNIDEEKVDRSQESNESDSKEDDNKKKGKYPKLESFTDEPFTIPQIIPIQKDEKKTPIVPTQKPLDEPTTLPDKATTIINTSPNHLSNNEKNKFVTTSTEQPRPATKVEEVIPTPQIEPIKKTSNQVLGQTYFGDGFYYSYEEQPKFHEDLMDDSEFYNNHQSKNLERIWQDKIKPVNSFLPQANGQHDAPQQNNQQAPQKSGAPAKNPTTGASGPFISLCEQIARQNINSKDQAPSNGFVNTYPQFPTVQEFAGNRQNVPLTGETSTSSTQILFNPGMHF